MWSEFDKGKSIGTEGSECGIITKDEEHQYGARITIEKKGTTAPWAITCGIYGSFMHTAFGSSEEEINVKYDKMKTELVEIMNEEDDQKRYDLMSRLADEF